MERGRRGAEEEESGRRGETGGCIHNSCRYSTGGARIVRVGFAEMYHKASDVRLGKCSVMAVRLTSVILEQSLVSGAWTVQRRERRGGA